MEEQSSKDEVETRSTEQAHDRAVAKGMALMIGAMLLIPVMDALAKILATQHGVTAAQTSFGRFGVQAVLMGTFLTVWFGPKRLLPRNVKINLLRGAVMSLAVAIFFTTLKTMPIADAIAVFFVEPFILTILSVLFLGERVGWRRSFAMGIGFAGALLVIQPSYEIFGWVSLMPIATAFLFAVYLVLTRLYAADDDPMAMQFMAGLGGCLMLAVVLFFSQWIDLGAFAEAKIPPFGIIWLYILALGIVATVGHLTVVYAFRLASASVLAPFQYFEIVTATILGYWLFGDFPDAIKWLGIFIIIGSGLYLFFREKQLRND